MHAHQLVGTHGALDQLGLLEAWAGDGAILHIDDALTLLLDLVGEEIRVGNRLLEQLVEARNLLFIAQALEAVQILGLFLLGLGLSLLGEPCLLGEDVIAQHGHVLAHLLAELLCASGIGRETVIAIARKNVHRAQGEAHLGELIDAAAARAAAAAGIGSLRRCGRACALC